MELERQWWKGQLASDIHQALRHKELKLPSYKAQSPQLSLRRYFADLIAIVSNRFKLCPAARHLAVYLLDLFMDQYDISIQQLHVVALSCLLLASKFEEKEDNVPKLDQLNSLGCMTNMNLVLTKQNLLHMELLVLETFKWNLCLPTAAHFIDYYLSVAISDTDLHNGWPMVCLEKTKLYTAKYADYFLEVSLQDHTFLSYAPSLVAAACVSASKIILRLSPTWPSRLHRLTAYSWELLVPCIERLLIAHDNDVREASKQKGQPGLPPAPCVFQTASQSPHPVQQHVSQCFSSAASNPNSAPLSNMSSTALPAGPVNHSYNHISTTDASCGRPSQCSLASADSSEHQYVLGRSSGYCIGVSYNAGFQVTGDFPCLTPCFER